MEGYCHPGKQRGSHKGCLLFWNMKDIHLNIPVSWAMNKVAS